MKTFFNKLVSGNTNDVSSKRFIALIALLLYIVVVVANVFFDFKVEPVVYYTLVSLILGQTILTVTSRPNNYTSDF